MLKEMTKEEYYAFEGLDRLPDGRRPLMAKYGPLTVIVAGEFVRAWVNDHELNGFLMESGDLQYSIDIAERILQQTKGMTPDQMQTYISSL